MNSSSSQPAAEEAVTVPARPVPARSWRRFLPFAAALLLTVTFASFPPALPGEATGAYDADASFGMILTDAHQHGIQFGTELVYTYGPLGYLIFYMYPLEGAGLHMLVNFVVGFAAATALCLVAWRIGPLWGALLVAGFVWVAANNQPRNDLILNTGLLCWGLLCFVETGRRLTLFVLVFTALAAFSALAKNSFLLIGTFSVVSIAGDLLLRNHRRLGMAMLVGFFVVFLSGWVAAGQSLTNLPAHLRNVVEMVRGYNEALGWEAIIVVGNIGWVLALLLTALILVRALGAFANDGGFGDTVLPGAASPGRPFRRGCTWRRLLLLAWISGLTFTVWKHGFVRAHPCNLEMCFGYLAVLALALNVLPFARGRFRGWTHVLGFACWFIPLLALQWFFFPPGLRSFATPFHLFSTNFAALLDPPEYHREMQAVMESNRRTAQLPRLREIIGEASVDVFGRRQAFAFYNGLNYRPRPAPQSYAVCNATLMRLNEQFLRSPKAPQFLLFELNALDRKFPILEDAKALRHLLINCEPVAAENPFVLLKSRAADEARLTLLGESTVRPGQHIDLRPFGAGPFWLEIELKPGWTGVLRQVFLRPPTIRLAAWDAPGGRLLARERAPACMLSAGFLASPLLRRTGDLLSLYAQNPATRPGSYSVELLPGDERFWREIRFRVYRLENPLARASSAEAAQFLESCRLDPALAGTLGSPVDPALTSTNPSARPFTIFRTTRWHPNYPPPGNPQERLAFLLFILVPVVTVWALVRFARNVRYRPTPTGWSVLLLGNSLVLLALLSAALLVAEIYFRFFYDTTDSLGYTRVCERWVQRHWHVNDAGCRDSIEYQPVIAPGKRRITFIGDSFTAGHGIKNVEARFPNLLRKFQGASEIHVVANVGLDTGSELVLLNRALKKGYQLDDVVLVYCLNDIGDVVSSDAPSLAQQPPDPSSAPWLMRNSYLLNFLYHRYKAARNPVVKDYFPHLAAAYRGAAWEQQRQRLKQFRDLVESNGGRLSVVTFPFLHALGPDYKYQFVHDQLDQLWRELGVSHLDLLPVYRDIPSPQLTVNPYDAHPNEYAAKLAANALMPLLFKTQAGPVR